MAVGLAFVGGVVFFDIFIGSGYVVFCASFLISGGGSHESISNYAQSSLLDWLGRIINDLHFALLFMLLAQ